MSIKMSAIGSIGTAVAVLVAAWQVRKSTQQARTDFEDDLSREYRELARSIPVKAHLGQELGEEELEQAFPNLYQYIDLTNEQIFLRMNGRTSKTTRLNWEDVENRGQFFIVDIFCANLIQGFHESTFAHPISRGGISRHLPGQ